MGVNLSQLEQYGRVAVHCSSEEHAEQFMEAMWEQFPIKVQRAWDKGQTNWSKSHEKTGIYYLPRLFHTVSNGEYDHCQSSSLQWVTSHNYSIVPFSDLLNGFDLGEIVNSEVDIKTLLEAW